MTRKPKHYSIEEIDGMIATLKEQLAKLETVCKLRRELDQLTVVARTYEGSKKVFDIVLHECAKEFNVATSAILGNARPEPLVIARHSVCWILRHCTDLTSQMIGKHMGNRDHGTILWADEGTTRRMTLDPRFDERMQKLKERCVAKLNAIEEKV